MNAIFRHELTAAVEMITPDIAAALLASNSGNRPIRKAAVAQLADDMRRGHWRLSHQGIAVARDGRLLDGQHRLSAIVEANVPVPMVVARNVDPSAFMVMDRGRPRSLRDILGHDSRLVDPSAYIARMHGRGAVEAHHAEEVLGACGPAILDLLGASASKAPGRTAAPIKAAAALRIMQGHRDYVLPQWRALAALDFDAMSSALKAFYRQIADETRRGRSGGSTIQNDRAVRAWLAFDPARSHVTKIQVKDVETNLNEMRAVWRPSWVAAV